ncbi:hypothetical protein P879_01541 [Paragonimus westermani]|uniref:WSC domain-containing protein n=1 Tax=Paragonimus westermani TaxID=34504 RepID=A0A8T0DWQ4_9TREM|nr:hypothetical protein P879_01541 [Paragonimus westermani]
MFYGTSHATSKVPTGVFQVVGRTGECSRACGIERYAYGGEWNKTACFCGNNLPATTIIDAQCSGKKQIYVNRVTQMPSIRITPIEVSLFVIIYS